MSIYLIIGRLSVLHCSDMITLKQTFTFLIILYLFLLLDIAICIRVKRIQRKTYKQMIKRKERSSKQYLKSPLIITDSPISDWTLFDNLEHIFTLNQANFLSESHSINCSNLDKNICNEYVSTFIYSNDNNQSSQSYEYWNKYELNYNNYTLYEKYMTYNQQQYEIKDVVDELINNNEPFNNNNNNNNDSDILWREHTYFRLMGLNEGETKFDSLQLNTLDHIRLSDYFKIFNVYNGYQHITDIHLWFGLNQYRAIRHFDTSNNLFFLLKGSRKFTLSKPTFNIFTYYPFGHKSEKHQYKYLSHFYNDDDDNNNYDDGDYDIYESTLYENEILYIPSHWWYQVENNNYSFALSILFNDGENTALRTDLYDYKLPINPQKTQISVGDLDEFFYFIQYTIDLFCKNYKNDNINPLLRCNGYNEKNNGYGYLLSNFQKIYPILEELNFDNFEWFSIGMDFENIFKCSLSNNIDEYSENFAAFKNDLYFCYDMIDQYKEEWNESSDDLIDKTLMAMNNDIIKEISLIEYFEYLLIDLYGGETTIIPIVVKLLLL